MSHHPWLLSVISQQREEGQQKTLEYLELECGDLPVYSHRGALDTALLSWYCASCGIGLLLHEAT